MFYLFNVRTLHFYTGVDNPLVPMRFANSATARKMKVNLGALGVRVVIVDAPALDTDPLAVETYRWAVATAVRTSLGERVA